jgi:SAM-dependent methyltransferase
MRHSVVLFPNVTVAPRGTAQRLDSFEGLMTYLPGSSFLDLGCNRGLYSIQAALAGAKVVHGCDAYRPGVEAARQVLADFRGVYSHFEVADLSLGPIALKPFDSHYDIVMLSGVAHKLRRQMTPAAFDDLILAIGARTHGFFAWRGYEEEIEILDRQLEFVGLRRVDLPIADELQPAAIWQQLVR